MEGILLRRYGGFYYVESEGQVWTCSLRGRFRHLETDLYPGDRVTLVPVGENEGVIEAVKPRTTFLVRPAIANIEQAIMVFALSEPSPDLELLDRLLLATSAEGIKAVIVWNKADNADPSYIDLPEIYKRIGYRSFVTSTFNNKGIKKLEKTLARRISTFAGPSGAGKSSLLNAIQPELNLATGNISAKVGRGRHITRHAELIRLAVGGWVADTPGFSRLFVPKALVREGVADHFPEMKSFVGQCRFSSCLHWREPGCAVVAAVDKGDIARHRYQHYLIFLEEVIAAERSY